MDYRIGLVVLLALMAGCSTMDDADLREEDRNEWSFEDVGNISLADFDPANVDADELSLANATKRFRAQYPPGVNESGIYNLTDLGAAHAKHLNGTAFVAKASFNITERSNGTGYVRLGSAHSVNRAGKGGTPRRGFTNQTDGLGGFDSEWWANETVRLERQTEPTLSGNTSVNYRRTNGTRNYTGTEITAITLGLVGEGDFAVESTEGAGNDTLITLSATSLNEEASNGSENVTDYQATMVVDGLGRVRSASMSAAISESSTGTGSMRFNTSFELAAVGTEVDVARPEWVDEALDATAS